MVQQISVRELARLLGGECLGDPERRVSGVAPARVAGAGDLAIAGGPGDLEHLGSMQAEAVLLPASLSCELPDDLSAIRVAELDAALAGLAGVLPLARPREGGVDPSAVIGKGVKLGDDVHIGRFAVIGDGVVVGDGCRIESHVVIGRDCTVGAGTTLRSHAVLYAGVHLGKGCMVHSGACVGADGFGFAFEGGQWRKIPQVGGCRFGDGVEIGANSTVDRGSVGDTRLGDGCALASLVHVGHNAGLGRGVRIAPLSVVAGSSFLGDEVELGAQVAITGHVTVGDRVRVAFQGGITQPTEAGEVIAGVPGRPWREARRAERLLARLPRLVERIRALERALSRPGDQPSGR